MLHSPVGVRIPIDMDYSGFRCDKQPIPRKQACRSYVAQLSPRFFAPGLGADRQFLTAPLKT